MPEQESGTQDVTAQLAAGLLGKSPIAQPQPPQVNPTPGVSGKEPDSVAAIDPETVKAFGDDLSSFKAQTSLDMQNLGQSVRGMAAAVEQLVNKQEDEGLKLDPDQLKNLSMGEAMEAMGKGLSAKNERQLKSFMRPFVQDLLSNRVQTELLMVKQLYPKFDIAKNVGRFQSERAQNPDLPLVDLVKRVATVEELSLADTPKTPSPQDGVQIEAGPAATPPVGSPAGGQPQGAVGAQGYTAEQQGTLLRALDGANKSGDRETAERYSHALLADRLAKSGGMPPIPGAAPGR